MRLVDIIGIVNFHMTPIEKAKQLGTFNQVDRSKQYKEHEPRELLRAVNEAWSKIRKLETENTKKDAALAALASRLQRSQIVNITLTAILTSLAWKGLEVLLSKLQ